MLLTHIFKIGDVPVHHSEIHLYQTHGTESQSHIRMKVMKCPDSQAAHGCCGLCLLFLHSVLHYIWLLFVKRERSSVDHYRESASAPHTAIAGFCLGEQIWEFLPRPTDKEGNI